VTPSLQKNFHGSKLQAATLTNESFPQNETGTPSNKRLHKLLYYENLMSRFFKTTKQIRVKIYAKNINIGTFFLTTPA
jgi:4-aminobutyrate aminotransferase-like enzyme